MIARKEESHIPEMFHLFMKLTYCGRGFNRCQLKDPPNRNCIVWQLISFTFHVLKFPWALN